MKNLILVCIYLIVTFCQSSSAQCINETNAVEFTYYGKTYEVIKERKTWEDAANCAVERGGYLVHIDSEEENEAVLSGILDTAGVPSDYWPTSGSFKAYVHIGATDKQQEDYWIWDGNNDGEGEQFWLGEGNRGDVPGSVVNDLYNNWGGTGNTPEEPNGYTLNHVGGMILEHRDFAMGGSMIPGQWSDIRASNELYFVIEYDCTEEFRTEIDTSICNGEEIFIAGRVQNKTRYLL